MFWKKKKIIDTCVEETDYEDQRASFRYVFKKGRQLSMTFKNNIIQVLDISAGGMAFKNVAFKKYDSDQVSLVLDMPNYSGDPILNARIRILSITQSNICHSIFENCRVEEYEMIHKYVLEMQKQDMTHQ